MQHHVLIDTVRYIIAGLTLVALTLGAAVYSGYWPNAGAPSEALQSAVPFMLGFLALSFVLAISLPRRIPRLIFLLGLFPLLVGWRIAALSNLEGVALFAAAAFVGYIVLFGIIAVIGLRAPADQQPNRITTTYSAIQLGFIRLYLGLDLVPHFTEKLFAGPGPRADDVKAFQALGISDALPFVVVAGIIELSAAIGVGLGVLTRLAAVLTVIYLMVATVMGHHFQLGFIWATTGGGWEYPVLWSALIFSFVLGGGRWLSLDEVISEHVTLPGWVKFLMGDTVSHTCTRLEK